MTKVYSTEDISIHAAREGGDKSIAVFQQTGNISIHAAREGGDNIKRSLAGSMGISIHAAREGGDYALIAVVVHNIVFQSTPPVKAATIHS